MKSSPVSISHRNLDEQILSTTTIMNIDSLVGNINVVCVGLIKGCHSLTPDGFIHFVN